MQFEWIGEAHRLSGSPRALTNTSVTAIRPRTASQARRAAAVVFHKGKVHSRRPLPRTRALIGACRLEKAVSVVGDRERVIAGTDCGFGTFAGREYMAEEIVWVKLAAAAEGCIASCGVGPAGDAAGGPPLPRQRPEYHPASAAKRS